MKKALALLLSVVIALSAMYPALTTVAYAQYKTEDAYATVFTASDFQSDTAYDNFSYMMKAAQEDGITEAPDAFLFAGDYTPNDDDPAVQVPIVKDTVQKLYPGYNESNMVFVQGNHDSASDVLTPTGFHEFDNILVYSINEDDFKHSQLGNNRGEAYHQEIQTLAQNIAAKLEEVKNSADTRPVFVVTHVPLHHMSRDNYGDNLYAKPIFDELNKYGEYLDIIFLFGHNHSDNYDDYIGGAVNYLAKGEEIRIPIPDAAQAGEDGYTKETLNFTYMNAGYVGYSNNSTIGGSTNTLTMGAFELCANTIEVSRYSTDGLYTTETISRVRPMTTDPYVKINGSESGKQGNSDILYGKFANIDAEAYSWTTSDASVVKVLPAGKNAQVIYTREGTADVTLTVTDKDGKTYSEKITINVESATRTETEDVPAEKYSVYVLTDTITIGNSYVIASGNTADSTTAMQAVTTGNSLKQFGVEVLDGKNDSEINGYYIKVTDESIVWEAGGSAQQYTFTNDNQTFLATDKNGKKLQFSTKDYNKWSYDNNTLKNTQSSGYIYNNNENYSASKDNSSKVYFYEYLRTVETMGGEIEIPIPDPYEPDVSFKKGSRDIDGERLEFYGVTYGEGFMIDGSFTGFSDQSNKVVTTWTSSNPSVATVENGYVTYVGRGETEITYTVTDGTTTITKSVTVFATSQEKPKTYYLLTNTLVDGGLYVIASAKELGIAEMLVPPVIETGKTDHNIRFSETDVTITEVDGLPNVATMNKTAVWEAISTGTDGYFYLRNVENGYYMYANKDSGTNDLGSTENKSTKGTQWRINADGFLVSDAGISIKHSSDGNFRACPENDAAESFLFCKTELARWVNIRLRYRNVQNNVLTRQNVCPFQSETLLARPEMFTVSSDKIAYTWESSNTEVATVDAKGVITYTGEPGTVEFTVVATATVPNADGEIETATATTTIIVEPQIATSADTFVLTDNFTDGEYYVISGSNTEGSAYILGNKTDTTTSSSEYRLNGVKSNIIQDVEDVLISNSDLANVWQAEDAGDGYFRLKNAQSGEYLALVADSNYSPYRRVTTAPLGEYDDAAYLISRNSGNQLFSKQSIEYSSNNLRMYEGYFRLSTENNKGYIYQKVSAEDSMPTAEIRVSTVLGTDNITNELQNRYNIIPGDTERLLRYTKNFEEIVSTKWVVTDESVATIDENGLLTYTGKNGFVTIKLTVTGKDSSGNTVTETVMTTMNVSTEDYESPTEDYPYYPHEGAVRINKTASNTAGGKSFQNTGVTEVELAVTGVPLPQAVDVVVVFDHSSSMNNNDRLTNAIADTREFAMQVVHANKSNRIAIVTFDRARSLYNGLTTTTTSSDSGSEDRIITGDGTPEHAFMTVNDSEELIAQIDSLAYNNVAGTNYDYGLQQAYQILKAAKSDSKANKMQYVVFMSDGEPFGFNRVDFGSATQDGYVGWHTGDEADATVANIRANASQYPTAQYFNTRGENWYAEIIKTPEGETLIDMPTADYYDGYREGLGATIFTIGYDAGETGTVTNTILSQMASAPENFYYAEGNLQGAYDRILEKILYAANNAVVTDKMGENFKLQVAPKIKLGNGMAEHTLNPAPYIEIGSWTLNSDGTRNKYTVHEKITFVTNDNGVLTAAYSDAKEGNIYNAATNVIVGSFVSYDMYFEEFTWHIGDITRDEITLRYYAYLEGSAEGEREAGIYDTNEYAELNYDNYRGTACTQVFPVPSLGWKEAAVSYEFYLVNAKGEPVNNDGIVVPFAERVLLGQEQTNKILLNSAGEYQAYTLVAKEELPDGYVLYNPATKYKITVSSGNNPGRAEIVDDADIKTTYFRDGTQTYCGDGVVPNVHEYTNTHVSFAVLYTKGIVPDTVVIDYGLPVKISVLTNDYAVSGGKITKIGTAFTEKIEYENIPFDVSMLADGVDSELALPDGTATIVGDKIVFTPTTLTMDKENVFYYEYQDSDGKFYYAEVTVIPAANIYYEESFFTFKDGVGYTWQTAGEELKDKFQAEDRPGNFSFADADANFVYGSDDVYNDSYTYSLGSAKYTSVDSASFGKEPTAEFTFCGTGFDLFSVTNSDTGAVLVSVYKTSDNKLFKNFIVNTYYGYTYDAETDTMVPAPDSSKCLYQIPVISARGLGYDTYKVIVKPLYSSMFDMCYDKESTDNSYDIYVDSVRIYDPAGEGLASDSGIGSVYAEDGEFSPGYLEIRKNVIDAETFHSEVVNSGSALGNAAIFIDGNDELTENGISNAYLKYGPNNELYLAPGQAIAFHIVSDSTLPLSSLQLGMKVVNGGEANVVMMNSHSAASREITVSGATENYRRLNAAIIWDQDVLAETGEYKTKYPVIILNNSENGAVLSLTHFKWAFSGPVPDTTPEAVSVSVDEETPAMAFRAVKRVLQPEPEEEGFPYTDEDITVTLPDTALTLGDTAVITIITPADVVRVTVGGIEVTQCEITENGNKLWTYSFTVNKTGENSFDILLYDNEGNASQPIKTESITVEESVTAESEKNIFELILEFFKTIITFFRRLFG